MAQPCTGLSSSLKHCQPLFRLSPDAGRLRLPVCRVLRLARERGSVVLDGGREPQDGDGGEALAVLEQLLDGLNALAHHRVVGVEPGDLERVQWIVRYYGSGDICWLKV